MLQVQSKRNTCAIYDGTFYLTRDVYTETYTESVRETSPSLIHSLIPAMMPPCCKQRALTIDMHVCVHPPC